MPTVCRLVELINSFLLFWIINVPCPEITANSYPWWTFPASLKEMLFLFFVFVVVFFFLKSHFSVESVMLMFS